jgi:glycosyltransferase involved in cell wall biosynthesis
MSVEPTIGVVVAVRNGADTIRATLDCVLAQDPIPADVVVLDGASTDGTPEIAAGIAGVRLVPQLGRGLGAARNQAVRVVRGDLVGFCDSDDQWTDGSLRIRVEHLAAHADCDAVVGHLVTTTVDGARLPVAHQASLGVPRPGYTPGALLARRHVFDRVGPFDEELRIGSDSDWFVRLRESDCRLDVLNDVVLMKGVRPTSLSNDIATYRAELMSVARAYVERRRGRG